MEISLILAASDNNIIGHDNQMPWHLSNDLKRFKSLTFGHPVIMGRKTFESLGRPLPGRQNIVITRNADYTAAGCDVVSSIEDALDMVSGHDEVFIIGGGQIYTQMWEKADNLYLTRVHTMIEGETSVPEITDYWMEVSRESYDADEKNQYPYTFIDYKKKSDL